MGNPSISGRDWNEKQKQHSSARERRAYVRLVSLGYRPIAFGEDEIRACFKFEGKCADIAVSNRENTCLLVECKGTSIGDAIAQLQNTAIHAARHFRNIEARVMLSGVEPREPVGDGCTAVRTISGAYGLVSADGQPVRIEGGSQIEVIFGP